jgi:hypothetical protein
MAWLQTSAIRNKFSIQGNKYDTQIDYASASAALALQRGLDATVFAEAIDDTEPTDSDELLRYQNVVESHSFLTMWFLIGNVGNKLGDVGFIKSAQDSASPAMQSRVITNSYLTPAELEKMKAEFLERAKFYIADYGTISIDAPSSVENTSVAARVSVVADW